MPMFTRLPKYEYKSPHTKPRRLIEFTFRWRHSLGILISVFVANQSDVDVASTQLINIYLVSAPICSNNILLKNERVEQAAIDRIFRYISLQESAHFGKLLLHT